MTGGHAGAIQRAFSQQAPAFEDPRYAAIFTTPLEWMFEPLALRPDDLLLDVAAGTGHAARALAGAVRCAVALDATDAMLAAGQQAAERAGVANVVFLRGDAAALPFPAGSFDVIVSRYSVHHFEDPAVPLGEIARCLRPGGRVAIADVVAAEDPVVAATQNHLERLRDPSHTRMLRLEELTGLVAGAGLRLTASPTREVERALALWLDQADTLVAARAEIGAELAAELAGGRDTGFRPREVGGEMRFIHRLASVIAVRAE